MVERLRFSKYRYRLQSFSSEVQLHQICCRQGMVKRPRLRATFVSETMQLAIESTREVPTWLPSSPFGFEPSTEFKFKGSLPCLHCRFP